PVPHVDEAQDEARRHERQGVANAAPGPGVQPCAHGDADERRHHDGPANDAEHAQTVLKGTVAGLPRLPCPLFLARHLAVKLLALFFDGTWPVVVGHGRPSFRRGQGVGKASARRPHGRPRYRFSSRNSRMSMVSSRSSARCAASTCCSASAKNASTTSGKPSPRPDMPARRDATVTSAPFFTRTPPLTAINFSAPPSSVHAMMPGFSGMTKSTCSGSKPRLPSTPSTTTFATAPSNTIFSGVVTFSVITGAHLPLG